MDIAIVSPSPKPFAVGGIEKLMLGLYSKIDEITDHRVELFKIPTQENDFWNLLDSYENFYRLDLSHFDMVITCKYPAWMLQHKNHVIYMAHHLRGLFDTYHFLKMPEKVKKTPFDKVNTLLSYTEEPDNLLKPLDHFFEMLHELKENQYNYPQDIFAFPSPIIRKIVHFLDKWALHPSRIARYTSISQTVAKRKDYFPESVNVDVIYPPTSLTQLHEGQYKYFLVVGRLDGPKRVSLIIEAMKHVNSDVELLIAGSGPEESNLRNVASGDRRIKFIGYINNQKLVDLYKDALAVIYVPYDEDYGLVTIEAMHCGKPVITCKDSGGTTEFVIHEQTGLLADSTPASLGKQMNILANDTDLAKKMGVLAKEQVASINWDNCIQNLLQVSTNDKSKNTIKSRKKITVLSTYPVFPRKHGGQLRIYNLYKNLDSNYDVTIVSLTKDSNGYRLNRGHFNEICIPMSQKHVEAEWELEKQIGIPVTDVAMRRIIPSYS
ncbi:glycosyltransferase family 4 protein [Paenibacillus sp. P25]|nr:glycosyltransferase family 4 protein [Paenibacillus sp. P25]